MSNATPHDTTIGSRVRARRERQGMTQAATPMIITGSPAPMTVDLRTMEPMQ